MALHRICAKAELPPGKARRLEDPPVAVFNINGELLAVGDICTHEGGPLSEGSLDGDTVECPWHYACFSLRTGEALTLPATEPVPTYPVIVQGEEIYVEA
jgi:3-phenylpropionate/trans-cinnamate dioxygenase ferredoxin component